MVPTEVRAGIAEVDAGGWSVQHQKTEQRAGEAEAHRCRATAERGKGRGR